MASLACTSRRVMLCARVLVRTRVQTHFGVASIVLAYIFMADRVMASLRLFVHLSIHISVAARPNTCLRLPSVRISILVSNYACTHMCMHGSMYVPARMPTRMPAHMPTHASTHFDTRVCPRIAHLSTRTCTCVHAMSIRISARLSARAHCMQPMPHRWHGHHRTYTCLGTSLDTRPGTCVCSCL